MKTLLWVGDAACGSGFGRASQYILENLKHRYNIVVLGLNYRGDPHPFDYPIYPAYAGGDGLGIRRIKEIALKCKPDLIVLQANPWNVPEYQQTLFKAGLGSIPLVGIIAVEGKNCTGYQLNGLQKAVFWTEFGRNEALIGGMRPEMPTAVIPLGVDTSIYKPGDQWEARQKLGLGPVTKETFIATNVNRNQNRKRIDLSIIYFAEWMKTRQVKDAYLFLHVLPGSSTRVDCELLAKYCGISGKIILSEPDDIFQGASEGYVKAVYQASDIGFNTSLGEGWGLTAMEAMACEKAYVAGDYSAFGEWGRDAMYLVPICSEGVMPDVKDMIGGVPSGVAMVEALDKFYFNDNHEREEWAAKALARATEPRFQWSNVAQRFVDEVSIV